MAELALLIETSFDLPGQLNVKFVEAVAGVAYDDCENEGLDAILKKLIIIQPDGTPAVQINTIP